jgi:hypothetical protein
MTSLAIKTYTVVIALICGATLAWSINQQHLAATSATDARNWQQLARATVAHDRATTHANHLLVTRYNRLVHRTAAAQKKLVRAVKAAQSTAATAGSQATVYRTVSGGTVYAPASSSVPAPTPAPVSAPPTTRTS